jgi:hypothetical protein
VRGFGCRTRQKVSEKRPRKVILGSVSRAGRDVVAGVYMMFAGVCWCLSGLWVYRFVSTKMESISAVPLMGTSFCISPLDGISSISLSFRRITRSALLCYVKNELVPLHLALAVLSSSVLV